MTLYPIIAKLKYQSKQLNIVLPMRATYIEIVTYECEKHGAVTLKKLIKSNYLALFVVYTLLVKLIFL